MVVPRLVSATAGPTVVPLRDLRMAARRLAVLTVVPMVVPKDLLTVGLSRTRPTAVQSATGFFYLAVITGFTAEIAAKIRFLP